LPFLFHMLTHDWSACLNLIFLNEVIEWCNNAWFSNDYYSYDDPLDDVIQGVVGIAWSVTLIHAYNLDSLYSQLTTRRRIMLVCYGVLYSVICSCIMAASWYIPKTIGLSVYTIVSTVLIYPLKHFMEKRNDGGGDDNDKNDNDNEKNDNQFTINVMITVTVVYGFINTIAWNMKSLNTMLIILFIVTLVPSIFINNNTLGNYNNNRQNVDIFVHWWVKFFVGAAFGYGIYQIHVWDDTFYYKFY
jgi:hypothetical protein